MKNSQIRLVAIVPFYNDFKALQRLLLSLSSIKLPAIFCDGRFTNFKKINNSDFSTDGSRFLILGFKLAKLISLGPCKVEEKLNKLFQEAGKEGYTHALLLGCDENISGNIDLVKEQLKEIISSKPQAFRVGFKEHNKGKAAKKNHITRIFYGTDLIKAKGSHNKFYATEKSTKKMNPLKVHPMLINDLVIHHDNSIRSEERNKLMKNYQAKLSETG